MPLWVHHLHDITGSPNLRSSESHVGCISYWSFVLRFRVDVRASKWKFDNDLHRRIHHVPDYSGANCSLGILLIFSSDSFDDGSWVFQA